MAGRAIGEQHRGTEGDKLIATFGFDYLIVTVGKDGSAQIRLKSEVGDEEVLVKVLVAKETVSKAVFAHLVPQKGLDADGYAVECLRKDLEWLGYAEVLLKSDNEPAIVALLKDSLKAARIS